MVLYFSVVWPILFSCYGLMMVAVAYNSFNMFYLIVKKYILWLNIYSIYMFKKIEKYDLVVFYSHCRQMQFNTFTLFLYSNCIFEKLIIRKLQKPSSNFFNPLKTNHIFFPKFIFLIITIFFNLLIFLIINFLNFLILILIFLINH